MKKIQEFLESKLLPFTHKINDNKYVKVMMNSFMGISALTIGSSFFTLALSLPLGDWYVNFLERTGLRVILSLPVLITSELISLYLILAVGYFTAKAFNKKSINGALLALGSFLMVTPFEKVITLVSEEGVEVSGLVTGVIPTEVFGAASIFVALIVGIVSVKLYAWLDDKDIKIKMPASVPENVTNMFETMIPASVILFIFLIVRVLASYTDYGTLQNIVYGLIQKPITYVTGGYWGAFVYTILALVLWLFGIHGSMLVYVAMAPVANAMWTENIIAFGNGLAAPHPEWNYSMYYTSIGGSGATMGLVLLMIFLAKSQHLKKLGKISFPTSIFGINEPIIFGTPMVMNATLAIPFILAPTVNFFLSTIVNKLGFAVLTGAMINPYFPIGILGMFATNNWTGFAWQMILIIIDTAIYYPFFKLYDSQKLKEEKLAEENDKMDLI